MTLVGHYQKPHDEDSLMNASPYHIMCKRLNVFTTVACVDYDLIFKKVKSWNAQRWRAMDPEGHENSKIISGASAKHTRSARPTGPSASTAPTTYKMDCKVYIGNKAPRQHV